LGYELGKDLYFEKTFSEQKISERYFNITPIPHNCRANTPNLLYNPLSMVKKYINV